MPKFFFDTSDGEHVIDQGEKPPIQNESTRQSAVRIVSELTPISAPHLWAGNDLRIVLRDEKGVLGFLTVMATRVT